MKNQTGLVKSKRKGGEIMKKVLMLTALVVLFAAPAMALNIKTSKHNLGATGNSLYGGTGTGTTQVCIYCHTPHNASPSVPLWNRTNPSGAGFTLYTGSPSLNINGADRTALSSDSISLFCLSCHDGATDSLAGRVTNRAGETVNADANIRAYANLGTNLTNDHPVNFSYDMVSNLVAGGDRGTDSDIRQRTAMSPAGASGNFVGGGLKFFKSTKTANAGAYLECATCHDPHGVADAGGVRVAKFLRKTNASSSLCLTCHIK